MLSVYNFLLEQSVRPFNEMAMKNTTVEVKAGAEVCIIYFYVHTIKVS